MSINLKKIPREPGVYLMKNKEGIVLYIGKAKELQKRIKQYFIPGHDGRIMVPFLVSQIFDIEIIITFSEKEALLLENTLIKKHQPKYNVLLKDDKTFISLMINPLHQWPMIKLIRYQGSPKKDHLYFGPYISAYAARQVLDLMTRVFKLRQCSDRELSSRTRPCLLYSIKRCLAPCVNKCTKRDYDIEVNKATQFLKGNNKEVIQKLKTKMLQASENRNYEKAGAIHKTITQIEEIIGLKQSIIQKNRKDCDVFSLYREGKQHIISQIIFRKGLLSGADHFKFIELASTDEEIWESFLIQHYQYKTVLPLEVLIPIKLKQKKLLEDILSIKITHPQKGEKSKLIDLAFKNAKSLFFQDFSREALLLDLQETCKLERCPVRIECFDTSNISGSNLVACMVGFTDGIRDKNHTRLFKIKGINKPDDYGALREVLTRHYIKAKKKDSLPDLALIDGGKGQLNVALEVFKKLDIASINVISLAKETSKHNKGLNFEKIFIPYHQNPIFLSPRSSTLFILQKIRDEAHRVAITFHKKQRSKQLLKTQLTDIPGIGPKKKLLLLKHFKSVKQIKKASQNDLMEVKGLNKKDIEALKEFQKE